MQPATLKRWHTTAFRVYWRRQSKGVMGRPPVSKEMRVLIRRLSRENPLSPDTTTKPKVVDGPFKLLSFPICGGLHHRYERVAA